MFTGDRSGDFLFRALHEAGFASQPESVSRDDGLTLSDVYISAAVRCVPPDNKPNLEEMLTCRDFLLREITLLEHLQIVVVLGSIALQTYAGILQSQGRIRARSSFAFGHGKIYQSYAGGPTLVTSYHPSQQNTSTGKLTREMLLCLFLDVRNRLNGTRRPPNQP